MSDIASRFASLSPEKRAILLQRLETKAHTEQQHPLAQDIVVGEVPLLMTQKQLLDKLSQYHLNIHYFNTTALLEIDFPIVSAYAQQTVQQLLRHHDALRLRLKREGNHWLQFITHPEPDARVQQSIPFSTIDLSTTPSEMQTQSITEHATQLQTSLNLFEGPIVRIAYFNLGPDVPGRLLFIVHHLACDALSQRILIEDFITAYKQIASGNQVKLPAKTASVKLRAEKMLLYSQSPNLQQDLKHWLSLPWSNVAPLPLDYPEHLKKPPTARFVELTLSKQETQALFAEGARAGNTRVKEHLLAALVGVFTSWMQSQSLVITMQHHGRGDTFEDLDLSRTVGWLALNPKLLLTVPTPQTQGKALLQTITQQLNTTPGITMEILQNASDNAAVIQALQALPRPSVVLDYMGQYNTPPSLHPASESIGADAQLPNIWKNDLHFLLIDIVNARLHIRWEYSSQVYRHETICTLMEQFIQTLKTLHQ